MQFSKYVGCGNDFILIDDRASQFPTEDRKKISHLCHRRIGVGADGIVLLQNSQKADFRMRIFNADGSEAEMCGNGIRCLLKYIEELGYKDESYQIETMESLIQVSKENEAVKVAMPKPYELRWNLPLEIRGERYTVHHLNTGVPHAVIFTEDLEAVELNSIGPLIRHHSLFLPRGANANFATWRNGLLLVRTYERGVEQETLACGTGATASAIAYAKVFGVASPICVQTKSGEILKIDFNINNNEIDQVYMTGAATLVYRGSLLW